MAQAWRSLGSEVVIVELFDRLLAREEPFVGEELAAAFADLGIEVGTGTKAVGAERSGEGVGSSSRAASGSLATGCSWPPAGTR